jgi:heme oxygenase
MLAKSSNIYFMRELLCQSIDGRRIDLLTITSFKTLTYDKEEIIPNLFP